METNKFLTEKERKRNARNAMIRSEYEQIRKTYPEITLNRAAKELARKHGLSVYMVYLICKGR
jgi:predicted nucleic acid-binding protein